MGLAPASGCCCCFSGKGWILFSTGAITFDFIELPTDDDDAGDGGSYRSGTTTDFWVGSSEAFSRPATGEAAALPPIEPLELTDSGDDGLPLGELWDEPELAPLPEAAAAPVAPSGVAWAARSLSLSRATFDEFVGQVERSLMVKPLRLIASLSNFS